MKLTQVAWRTVGGAALTEYRDDDIPGLATEMAYWIVFSIFPFFIFLATLTRISAHSPSCASEVGLLLREPAWVLK